MRFSSVIFLFLAIFADNSDWAWSQSDSKMAGQKSLLQTSASNLRPTLHQPAGPRHQIRKPKVLYNDANETLKSAASSYVDDADIGFDHEEEEINAGNGLRDIGSGSYGGNANSYDSVMALIAGEPPSPLAVSSLSNLDSGITSTSPPMASDYQPPPVAPIRVPVRSNGFQSPALKARKKKTKSKSVQMNVNNAYDETMKGISNFDSSYSSSGYDDRDDGYSSRYSGMGYNDDSYEDHDAWQNVFGVPGVDYPAYSSPPVTSFSCASQMYPGYYVDVESNCQAFHICQSDGRQDTFLCPNATLFNQQFFVCDWYFNVDCSQSRSYYNLNANLFVEKGLANSGFDMNSQYNGRDSYGSSFSGGYDSYSSNYAPSSDELDADIKSGSSYNTDDGSYDSIKGSSLSPLSNGNIRIGQKSRRRANHYASTQTNKWFQDSSFLASNSQTSTRNKVLGTKS